MYRNELSDSRGMVVQLPKKSMIQTGPNWNQNKGLQIDDSVCTTKSMTSVFDRLLFQIGYDDNILRPCSTFVRMPYNS